MAGSHKRILFISGSMGLGHVTRDVAIANELRNLRPDAAVEWLASSPGREYLLERGEKLVPQAHSYADVTSTAEKMARPGRLNAALWAYRVQKDWEKNARLSIELMGTGGYDLAVGDETYDLLLALAQNPGITPIPLVVLFDFVGLDTVTWHPLERIAVFMFNRLWARPPAAYTAVFLGLPEDVPDKRFVPWGPSRRAYTRSHLVSVGYPLHFDPADYADRPGLKRDLGYGDRPLAVAAIGGTAVGRELLALSGRAFDLVRRSLPDLQCVLVAGPRLSPDEVDAPEGVEVRGYVPDLYRLFAACDVAVVQGGGTSTLELTALRRPFIYFPLEEHFEQIVDVAGRLDRHRAGERMFFSKTTEKQLAERVLACLGREVDYADIPVDGAARAAELIASKL
jgi:UDP:flavonoid glycosyltransferase YjiC (YdhE family)